MVARIYRPAKTATQSGKAKSHTWVLEFEPESPRSIDPLMGYTSSDDMKQQIKLRFETKEDAIAYAKRNGLSYRIEAPKERPVPTIAYADNFKFNRYMPWTH